jgi:hypothetical protein
VDEKRREDGRKKGSRYGVSPPQFVQAWQASDSVDAVCERLHMPRRAVLARALSYRSKGVLLKPMPRETRARLDVPSLNRQIKDLEAVREVPAADGRQVEGRDVCRVSRGCHAAGAPRPWVFSRVAQVLLAWWLALGRAATSWRFGLPVALLLWASPFLQGWPTPPFSDPAGPLAVSHDRPFPPAADGHPPAETGRPCRAFPPWLAVGTAGAREDKQDGHDRHDQLASKIDTGPLTAAGSP